MSALRELIERAFKTVETMDVKATVALFADDGVLFDPHYPTPKMVGKAAIADGLTWGFGAMSKMSFPIVNYFEAEGGASAAIEVATAHVLKSGMKLNFPQMFVIETRDGLVTRMQAYEPYGPEGIVSVILGLTRLQRKLTGKG
ncbi:MAG: nuclear transport factor 2 family protein [Anaerolineae bacterium]